MEGKDSGSISKGLKGTISNIDISQLLQMVCVSDTPLMIKVTSEEREGVFYIKDGHVLHAHTGKKDGEEAFFEMALWDNVVFEIIPHSINDIPHTILKPWEYLALESARVKDESIKEQRIHVLIVDDSVFFARQLKRLIEDDPEFVVVGIASNGEEAIGYVEDEIVDVITLDAFMPVMPGDTTLKHLMIRYGIPVVVISAFLEGSADTIFDFLRLGAVDIFPKPKNRRDDQEEYGRMLRSVLKKASKAKIENFRLWKPGAITSREIAFSNSAALKFLAVVGLEGSYMDWFRLPFDNFLSVGYVSGFSGIDIEFLTSFSKLLVHYIGYGVKTFLGKEEGNVILSRDAINIFHANSVYHFEKLDNSYKVMVLREDISKLTLKSVLEENLLRLVSLVRDKVGILCLSGAERFSDEWLETMFEYPVRWLLPSEDLLMFPQMAGSVLEKSAGRHVEIFQGTYEDIGNYWVGL